MPHGYDPDVQRSFDGLRRLVRALRVSGAASERAIGLSAAQLFVLRQLAAHPQQSLSDLAARTATAQSSVSEVVARLVQRGLVVRRAAADDRRRAEVSLTDQGRELLDRAPSPVQERLIAALERMPAESRREIADALETWVREAGLAEMAPTMFFEEAESSG